MTIFEILLISVCFQYSISQDKCDPHSGPSGESCVYIPAYDRFQLATCAMSSDIMILTNNSFKCTNSCRNYCWLPCMVEKYGALNGAISADCNCTLNDSWCSENTGAEAFFRFCLDSVHRNCSSDGFSRFAYILTLYLDDYLKESTAHCSSKDWIRTFRVCVQNYTTPELLQNLTATCDEVDSRGFEILELCLSGICQTTADFRNPYFIHLLEVVGNQTRPELNSQYVPRLQSVAAQNCTSPWANSHFSNCDCPAHVVFLFSNDCMTLDFWHSYEMWIWRVSTNAVYCIEVNKSTFGTPKLQLICTML